MPQKPHFGTPMELIITRLMSVTQKQTRALIMLEEKEAAENKRKSMESLSGDDLGAVNNQAKPTVLPGTAKGLKNKTKSKAHMVIEAQIQELSDCIQELHRGGLYEVSMADVGADGAMDDETQAFLAEQFTRKGAPAKKEEDKKDDNERNARDESAGKGDVEQKFERNSSKSIQNRQFFRSNRNNFAKIR